MYLKSVSKPVKSNYLLKCMNSIVYNSIVYLLLTSCTLIMFLNVSSQRLIKIKKIS